MTFEDTDNTIDNFDTPATEISGFNKIVSIDEYIERIRFFERLASFTPISPPTNGHYLGADFQFFDIERPFQRRVLDLEFIAARYRDIYNPNEFDPIAIDLLASMERIAEISRDEEPEGNCSPIQILLENELRTGDNIGIQEIEISEHIPYLALMKHDVYSAIYLLQARLFMKYSGKPKDISREAHSAIRILEIIKEGLGEVDQKVNLSLGDILDTLQIEPEFEATILEQSGEIRIGSLEEFFSVRTLIHNALKAKDVRQIIVKFDPDERSYTIMDDSSVAWKYDDICKELCICYVKGQIDKRPYEIPNSGRRLVAIRAGQRGDLFDIGNCEDGSGMKYIKVGFSSLDN